MRIYSSFGFLNPLLTVSGLELGLLRLLDYGIIGLLKGLGSGFNSKIQLFSPA
jgi:hypothetical protein